MRAVIVEQPGQLALRDIPCPRPGPYEALVRMQVAAICNSTDTKILEGHVPFVRQYPTTLGHEGLGTVVEVGERVVSYRPGDRVLNACTLRTGVAGLGSGWGTMAEYALAGDFAAMSRDGVCDEGHGFDGVFETQRVVPPDLPERQAILLSTWREVWSSFPDFGFAPGRSVLVIGGGPVGLSFAMLTRQWGMEPVALATRSAWKLEKALRLGAQAVFPAVGDWPAQARQQFPKGFDYVADAVGSPTVINQALRLVKPEGTVAVYGTLAEQTLPLSLDGAPANWRLLVHQWPNYAREAAAQDPLCRMIREGRISSEEFITHELPFERVAEGFALIRQNRALKVLLRFPGE
jgi:threonine dehydrogenase-like Zn-dependent dehydrogenase